MKKLTNSFVTGAVALVFGVLGYQTALLVHYSAVSKIVADRDRPDTVFVYANAGGPEATGGGVGTGDGRSSGGKGGGGNGGRSSGGNGGRSSEGNGGRSSEGGSSGERKTVKRSNYSGRDARAQHIHRSAPPAEVETFRFNPNTIAVEDMVRLGFSRKQAESIDHYRAKGGRFRRKEDFAKSYTVSDAMYRRLEAYIDIPLLDINKADSAAFDGLPGIGGYFARKMVEYRIRLHGYSYPEQLMDIYHFDQEKFDKLKDLITVGTAEPYPLWSLPADSLRLHPYIGNFQTARSIVFYREHNPREAWTVEGLATAGILSPAQASSLSRCRIE